MKANPKHTITMSTQSEINVQTAPVTDDVTNVVTDDVTNEVPSDTNSDANSEVQSSSKNKKERMTLRKRFPKVELHRRTPYQFYIKEKAKENRDSEGPPKSAAEYSKQWKLETDRSRWFEMAAKDEIRFIEEVRSHGYTYDPVKKDRKRKKPCAPFLLYARDKSPKLREEQGVTYREALKILGTKWKENTEPEIKAQYIEIAKKEKEKFDAEQASDDGKSDGDKST